MKFFFQAVTLPTGLKTPINFENAKIRAMKKKYRQQKLKISIEIKMT